MSVHIRRPLPAALGLSNGEGISDRIANGVLDRSPFPHLVQPAILPAFTRADVHSYWPEEASFTAYSDGHDRSPGDRGRFGIYVMGSAAAARCSTLDEDTRSFWRDFAAGPARQAVLSLYRRFLPGLRARFGSRLPELELETFAVLVNCYQRLSVGVHADHPAFLFTAMIYLNNGAERSAGTTFYVPKLGDLSHDGLAYLAHQDFRPIKSLPFTDNTLVGFLRTGNSFHGVEPMAIGAPSERATVNLHVRLTESCVERLYGEDVALLFRERKSGHCPWLLPSLDAWRQADWDDATPATEAELRPLLNSFRYGEELL